MGKKGRGYGGRKTATTNEDSSARLSAFAPPSSSVPAIADPSRLCLPGMSAADLIRLTLSSTSKPATLSSIHSITKQSLTLLVGEGDFSFCSALVAALNAPQNIVATSLDSLPQLSSKYTDSVVNRLNSLRVKKCTILHRVDCTTMSSDEKVKAAALMRGRKGYDIVVFNFPHVGGSDDDAVEENCTILRAFFREARALLDGADKDPETKKSGSRGKILVALRDTPFYESWNIESLASAAGLSLFDTLYFETEKLAALGYTPQRTNPAIRKAPTMDNASVYVFEPSTEVHESPPPPPLKREPSRKALKKAEEASVRGGAAGRGRGRRGGDGHRSSGMGGGKEGREASQRRPSSNPVPLHNENIYKNELPFAAAIVVGRRLTSLTSGVSALLPRDAKRYLFTEPPPPSPAVRLRPSPCRKTKLRRMREVANDALLDACSFQRSLNQKTRKMNSKHPFRAPISSPAPHPPTSWPRPSPSPQSKPARPLSEDPSLSAPPPPPTATIVKGGGRKLHRPPLPFAHAYATLGIPYGTGPVALRDIEIQIGRRDGKMEGWEKGGERSGCASIVLADRARLEYAYPGMYTLSFLDVLDAVERVRNAHACLPQLLPRDESLPSGDDLWQLNLFDRMRGSDLAFEDIMRRARGRPVGASGVASARPSRAVTRLKSPRRFGRHRDRGCHGRTSGFWGKLAASTLSARVGGSEAVQYADADAEATDVAKVVQLRDNGHDSASDTDAIELLRELEAEVVAVAFTVVTVAQTERNVADGANALRMFADIEARPPSVSFGSLSISQGINGADGANPATGFLIGESDHTEKGASEGEKCCCAVRVSAQDQARTDGVPSIPTSASFPLPPRDTLPAGVLAASQASAESAPADSVPVAPARRVEAILGENPRTRQRPHCGACAARSPRARCRPACRWCVDIHAATPNPNADPNPNPNPNLPRRLCRFRAKFKAIFVRPGTWTLPHLACFILQTSLSDSLLSHVFSPERYAYPLGQYQINVGRGHARIKLRDFLICCVCLLNLSLREKVKKLQVLVGAIDQALVRLSHLPRDPALVGTGEVGRHATAAPPGLPGLHGAINNLFGTDLVDVQSRKNHKDSSLRRAVQALYLRNVPQ
ncbi:hypothetical protein BDK51DRAFT_45045 [Blyttiomyces helicus]|uniref:25S rRNA (uridine-N(3))-methyltransferase BMT5-like domain-containing protein n=1 Tax=Blyttiomyces helicus TaxID=388810 RepID=A0A4V1IS23_9FUNG|nr:hypothetical protein BDK51DRAFT_45045 [Blyttiomyces helicus]|eukprot:RKO92057.1 hypothetical protein BDK51DRAFT_45045 [Blyttiomyces helicus]